MTRADKVLPEPHLVSHGPVVSQPPVLVLGNPPEITAALPPEEAGTRTLEAQSDLLDVAPDD